MTAVLLEPHADDAILFSCWNLLRYRPRVITVLRSDRMANIAYPGGQVAHSTRVLETVQAMNLLGVQHEQWDFSDAAPDWDAVTERLAALEADIVFAPAVEEGGHDQHNSVGSLAQIIPAEIVSYTTYTRHGGRSTSTHEVPFEPDWPVVKLRALACYGSQIAHPATAPHFVDVGLREWIA